MRSWLRILPYGFVVWLAKRRLEAHPDAFGMAAINIFAGEMLCFEAGRPHSEPLHDPEDDVGEAWF